MSRHKHVVGFWVIKKDRRLGLVQSGAETAGLATGERKAHQVNRLPERLTCDDGREKGEFRVKLVSERMT